MPDRTPRTGRIARSFLSLAAGLVLSIAALPAAAHEISAGSILIAHPYVREVPEGAKVAGGYALILNEGTEPDRLLAVSGEIAGRAEIHEMKVDDKGVMQMRKVEGGLEVPAGGELSLEPGSYHFMFMDLQRRVKEGDTFRGTLTFEKAGTVEIEFAVDAMGARHGHH